MGGMCNITRGLELCQQYLRFISSGECVLRLNYLMMWYRMVFTIKVIVFRI